MRLTPLRRLILLAVLGFLLVITYLRECYDGDSTWTWWLAPNPRPKDAARIAKTREFWSQWATVYDAARPQIPKIELHTSASDVKVKKGQQFRKSTVPIFSVKEQELESLKDSHAILRRALDTYDTSDAYHLFEGMGIVTVAGGEYYGPAIVGIHALRQSGSMLPVEVFLANEEEYESRLCESYLPKLNARCLVLTDFIEPSSDQPRTNFTFDITHYQLKALALLFSSFRDVLLLDSDSIPLLDPRNTLFESDTYIETGFIGWPDFWIGTEHPAFYTIAGKFQFPSDLPPSSAESGQLVLDKSRHLKTLLLAVYYNIFGPGYYYELLSQGAVGQGDKNTFESAAVILDAPYHRVNFSIDYLGRWNDGVFKGSAMVQKHPESGKTAFVHANTPKMNAGHLVDEGDLVDHKTGRHLRLWEEGHENLNVVEVLGLNNCTDVEARIWEIVRDTGCDLEGTLREWKDRKGLCKRLKDHWDLVFGKKADPGWERC